MADQKKQGSGQGNWGQTDKEQQGSKQAVNKEASRAGKPYSAEENEEETESNTKNM